MVGSSGAVSIRVNAAVTNIDGGDVSNRHSRLALPLLVKSVDDAAQDKPKMLGEHCLLNRHSVGKLTCRRAERYTAGNGDTPALTHFQKLPKVALKA